jgi:hypothetical protein
MSANYFLYRVFSLHLPEDGFIRSRVCKQVVDIIEIREIGVYF